MIVQRKRRRGNGVTAILKGQFHVCGVMRCISLVVHGHELQKRHRRQLGPVLYKMPNKYWKAQHLMELGERPEIQKQKSHGKDPSHGVKV